MKETTTTTTTKGTTMIHQGTFTKVNGGWDDVWGYRIVGGDAVEVGDQIEMTTKAGTVSTVFVLSVQGIEKSSKFGDAIVGEFCKTAPKTAPKTASWGILLDCGHRFDRPVNGCFECENDIGL